MIQAYSLLNQFDTLEAEKKCLHDIICFRGIKLFGEQMKLLLGIKGFSVLTPTVSQECLAVNEPSAQTVYQEPLETVHECRGWVVAIYFTCVRVVALCD